MTEEEFLNEGGIPLDALTDDDNRIIDGLIEAAWLSGQFEIVSAERTGTLIQKAVENGADQAVAARLVRHFDAATQFIQSMPEEQKQQVYANIEEKFGPRPA